MNTLYSFSSMPSRYWYPLHECNRQSKIKLGMNAVPSRDTTEVAVWIPSYIGI